MASRSFFRTVGNDSTFYRPPTANQLKNYLNQIPDDFQMCFKVWEELTIPSFSSHPRYGTKAVQPNARFLDASLFKELVLAPYREANFGPHAGPFLFEFQRHGMLAKDFVGKLDVFSCSCRKIFSYAIEIRNGGLLGPLYRDMLEAHGVGHVYNHWSFMPSLAEQHQKMETFTGPFRVVRLLTPLKMSYEVAKKRAEPYTKIVGELPDMRKEVVMLMKDAIGHNRRAYVLVNNRLEGNAPLTVQALTDLLS